MSFWELLRNPRLLLLLRVRWSGQFVDGLFQSALASFILFSPERQVDALSAALAFAVVLAPYSIVGPFLGTILDRRPRQRTLLFSNAFRGANLLIVALFVFSGVTGLALTAFVLIAFGINRLILAGLSASLPLLVDPKALISANAIAVTGGSVFVIIGGAIGVGARSLVGSAPMANHADALLIIAASFGYFLTAFFTSRLKKYELGPLQHEIRRASFTSSFIEMREGFQFLRIHSDAARGIVATAVHRGGLTALTLTALLLNRNTFNDPNHPEAGLAGFGITMSVAGIGLLLGAFLAPYGVSRIGRHKWIRYSLFASALGPLFLVAWQNPISLGVTAFFTAFCGQNVKVTNDALVQSKIDDYYRGRVFALYDVAVNGAVILGGLLAALLLPTSGISRSVPALTSLLYLLTAALFLSKKNFRA